MATREENFRVVRRVQGKLNDMVQRYTTDYGCNSFRKVRGNWVDLTDSNRQYWGRLGETQELRTYGSYYCRKDLVCPECGLRFQEDSDAFYKRLFNEAFKDGYESVMFTFRGIRGDRVSDEIKIRVMDEVGRWNHREYVKRAKRERQIEETFWFELILDMSKFEINYHIHGYLLIPEELKEEYERKLKNKIKGRWERRYREEMAKEGIELEEGDVEYYISERDGKTDYWKEYREGYIKKYDSDIRGGVHLRNFLRGTNDSCMMTIPEAINYYYRRVGEGSGMKAGEKEFFEFYQRMDKLFYRGKNQCRKTLQVPRPAFVKRYISQEEYPGNGVRSYSKLRKKKDIKKNEDEGISFFREQLEKDNEVKARWGETLLGADPAEYTEREKREYESRLTAYLASEEDTKTIKVGEVYLGKSESGQELYRTEVHQLNSRGYDARIYRYIAGGTDIKLADHINFEFEPCYACSGKLKQVWKRRGLRAKRGRYEINKGNYYPWFRYYPNRIKDDFTIDELREIIREREEKKRIDIRFSKELYREMRLKGKNIGDLYEIYRHLGCRGLYKYMVLNNLNLSGVEVNLNIHPTDLFPGIKWKSDELLGISSPEIKLERWILDDEMTWEKNLRVYTVSESGIGGLADIKRQLIMRSEERIAIGITEKDHAYMKAEVEMLSGSQLYELVYWVEANSCIMSDESLKILISVFREIGFTRLAKKLKKYPNLIHETRESRLLEIAAFKKRLEEEKEAYLQDYYDYLESLAG